MTTEQTTDDFEGIPFEICPNTGNKIYKIQDVVHIKEIADALRDMRDGKLPIMGKL